MENRRIRAGRLVDFVRRNLSDTGSPTDQSVVRKVFAYACGRNACNPGVIAGRKVDVRFNNKYFPKYGYTSEDCAYPPNYKPEWVLKDIWPPPSGGQGISKLLRLRVIDTETCPGLHCTSTLTEYDGSGWTWNLGPVSIRMTVNAPGTGTGTGTGTAEAAQLVFTVVEGSCPITIANQPNVICTFPLKVEIELIPATSECCGCCPNTTGRIYLRVEGFCDNIYMARLLDYQKDSSGIVRKVFGYTECKSDFECPDLDCCVDFDCTLDACFIGLDGCGCLDGLCVRMTPRSFPKRWSNDAFGSCGCQWDVELVCTGTVNGLSQFEWLVNSSNNCGTPITTFTATQICTKNFDIEFEFTLFCPTCEESPPAPIPPCCDCGNYRYIARITRASCP